jgi:hypothetical protein
LRSAEEDGSQLGVRLGKLETLAQLGNQFVKKQREADQNSEILRTT